MLTEDIKRTPQSLDKRPWIMNFAVRNLYDPVKPRGVGDGDGLPDDWIFVAKPLLADFSICLE